MTDAAVWLGAAVWQHGEQESMGKLFYRIITGVLLAGWMLTIFRFSAQPAVESEKVSGSVSYRVVEAYCEMFHKELPQDKMAALAERIDYPIRKAAHMTEYAIMGILAYAFLAGYWEKKAQTYLAALLIAALYAASDEIHQLFVPGRAGRFSDVCIDTLGALLGLFALFLLQKIWEMIAKRRGLHYNKNISK